MAFGGGNPCKGGPLESNVYLTTEEQEFPILVRRFLISAAQNQADPERGMEALRHCVRTRNVEALRAVANSLLFVTRQMPDEDRVEEEIGKAYLAVGIVESSRNAFQVLRQF